MMKRFLENIAELLISDQNRDLSGNMIVLPGKRAGTELKKHIADKLKSPYWAPVTLTLPELTSICTSKILATRIEQTISLFNCYKSLKTGGNDSFHDFIKWGGTVLNDFGDIDHHLISPETIFSDLRKIQNIQNWSFNSAELSDSQLNYLSFWNDLGELYQKFVESQYETQKFTYSGVLSGCDSGKIDINIPAHISKIMFAGLANYSPAELSFIDKLGKRTSTEIIWDADAYYLNNSFHEAGALIRKSKKEIDSVVLANPGLSDSAKNIFIHETITPVAEAIACASKLNNEPEGSLANTAVIITDNSLYEPFIHAIDHNKVKTAVAVSIPSHQTATGKLFSLLFQILSKKEETGNDIYYKDLCELIGYYNNLTTKKTSVAELNQYLIEHVIVYVGKKSLCDIIRIFPDVSGVETLLDLNTPEQKIVDLQKYCNEIINDTDNGGMEKAGAQCANEILLRLHRLISDYPDLNSYRSTAALWQHLLSREYISPESKDPEGIKILDLNESLGFDFNVLHIIGANEDTLPGNSFHQSLIPFDLRSVYNLPLPGQNDALTSYMFYRAMQRAECIHLYYSSNSADFKVNEKSRYIEQIRFELCEINPLIKMQSGLVKLPEARFEYHAGFQNNDEIKRRLDVLFERGISPSAINKFLLCPQDFYFRYILGLGEDDEMEEEMTAATIGSIVHKVLEDFYIIHKGSYPTEADFVNFSKIHLNRK